jgi:SAM-dependent methyltransferase
MTARTISPYLAPNFYADALSKGRHRDIVGGRWDETGRVQMAALLAEGLAPHHRLLDIGCGSLRLGCKAVPYLNPGHYWGTDLSGPLMQRGYQLELADKPRLPPTQLIEDPNFTFPGVPPSIDYAIAFAVFTHLPADHLRQALTTLHTKFPNLHRLLFTVFLAPDHTTAKTPYRQPDGVVTHPNRAPYHMLAGDVTQLCQTAGFTPEWCNTQLPRGQALCVAQRTKP